jgi:Ca-activated chloride channel family protein
MILQQPAFLFGLLVVAALAGLYVFAQRRRRRYTMRFTDVALLQSVAGRGPGIRRHVPPALFLLGAAGLVMAAAQPLLYLEVASTDASVMLVIDTSGSMDAVDVQPTRLDAARSAAHTLIDHLPANTRIGLVSFSTSPILAAPLTDNRQSVLDAIDALQAGGATATGDALSLAVSQLSPTTTGATSSRPPAMIVLLTDGVTNRGSDPLAAAAKAKAASIRIITVGVGSRNDAVTVHGQRVGGVDDQALGAIASATGGKYYFAEEAGQLSQIYSNLGTAFGWRFLRFDATVPLIIAGTVVVLAGAGLSLYWFRVLP